MILPPPRSTPTDTLLPFPTLFRSQHHGLSIVIGLHVLPRRGRQHGEAAILHDTGDPEPGFADECEEPLVLEPLLRVRWNGEFIEAVRRDQAPVAAREASVLGAEIEDGQIGRASCRARVCQYV